MPGGGYMIFVPEVGDYAIYMPLLNKYDDEVVPGQYEYKGFRAAASAAAGAIPDRTAFNPASGNMEYQQWNAANKSWDWTGTLSTRPPTAAENAPKGGLTEAELIAANAQKLGPGVYTISGIQYRVQSDGSYGIADVDSASAAGSGSTKLDGLLAGLSSIGRAGGAAGAQTGPPGAPTGQGVPTGQGTPTGQGAPQPPAGSAAGFKGTPPGPGWQKIFADNGIAPGGSGSYASLGLDSNTGASTLHNINAVTNAGMPGQMIQHINPGLLAEQNLALYGMKPTGDMSKDLAAALDIEAYKKAQWAMPGATAGSVSAALDYAASQKSAERNKLLGDLLGHPMDGSYGKSGGMGDIAGFARGGNMTVNEPSVIQGLVSGKNFGVLGADPQGEQVSITPNSGPAGQNLAAGRERMIASFLNGGNSQVPIGIPPGETAEPPPLGGYANIGGYIDPDGTLRFPSKSGTGTSQMYGVWNPIHNQWAVRGRPSLRDLMAKFMDFIDEDENGIDDREEGNRGDRGGMAPNRPTPNIYAEGGQMNFAPAGMQSPGMTNPTTLEALARGVNRRRRLMIPPGMI